jgi:hypothetical protein
MSDLQKRIEYIIESEDDTESRAAKIVAMIERRDRHIAKLAGIGVGQETEIVELRRRIEALEARPALQPLMPPPVSPLPYQPYNPYNPFNPYSPTYPIITSGSSTCQSNPSTIV